MVDIKQISGLGTLAAMNITVTSTLWLYVEDWLDKVQTVTVAGLTASSIAWIVINDATTANKWALAKVFATGQDEEEITFGCTDTPEADLEFKLIIIN